MPIAGLTNPPKSFLKIGQIRKGEMREMQGTNGKYLAPVDLDYFRVTFRPDEKECEEEFIRVYGATPRRINIRFPFKTIEEVWDANYECYSKGGLIAKAGSNERGLYWIFFRNHDTGEVLVRNGSPVARAGRDFIEKPIDVSKPIYSYKDKKGNDVPVMLEPVGRLQVVVPELAHLRVGYLEFRPNSPKDIAAISRELAGIDMLARQAGRDISGIPFVLSRREEDMTKNINGKLSQGKSWLVHLEVVGAWGQKALTVLERNSTPDIVDAEVRELPFDEEWDGGSESVVPELIEETETTKPATLPTEKKATPAPQPATHAPAPEPAHVDPPGRPYTPEVFRQKFLEGVEAIEKNYADSGKELNATTVQRSMVASVLDKVFGGNKLQRHEFCNWLIGVVSTADMSPAQIKVFTQIMKVTDYKSVCEPTVAKEILLCHAEALRVLKETQPA